MGRYSAKVNNRDSVSICHGETADFEIRIYDPATVLPFNTQGYTPKVFFPKTGGGWLEVEGVAINNHLGQFRVALTEAQVCEIKLSEVPPKAKDPAPVPIEVLLESATARVIVQLKSHLVVLPRLAAPAAAN